MLQPVKIALAPFPAANATELATTDIAASAPAAMSKGARCVSAPHRTRRGSTGSDIGGNEAFQAQRREQRCLHHIRTAHENSDLDTVRKGYQDRAGMRENLNSLFKRLSATH